MSTTVDTQLDVASRVLDLVRDAAGSGAEAEVLVSRQELALTRFANSYIHQNVADAVTHVRLRLHLEGRTAVGSSTQLGDGLRDLVDRTVAATRLSPLDPGWPGLTPPSPPPTSGNVDEATVAATPDERALRVRAFIDAASGLNTAGYFRTNYVSAAFANSAGQSAAGAMTEAAMDGIARTATSDGVARLASVRLADIDGSVLGTRAAAKALASQNPVELPPGQYEVVLESDAVVDLLRNFAMWGFNGKAYLERRSFAQLGERQFDEAVTFVEDVTTPRALGLPFDVEGTPKRRVEFVANGVTRTVAHDRRTAAQAGTESTGNAHPAARAFGPIPLGMTMVPPGPEMPTEEVAGPAADLSVMALVSGVRRGLLVTDFWYTRVLDPRPLVITGLTRNGVWLIEDGEITTPVKNFRFTQAYPQALAPGAVLGVGTHLVAQPGDWGSESFVAPAVRLGSWNFTGGASG
ncbi:TldD/PmbA family protein [Planosporangium flavigriseum]|uniref:Peptidase U62 n=1 Tax=Planosporangium flavigriseum TaxID=373681 RepID=A0A8J3M2U6_9ACTN|nr:TldD/PmbA family protein [Planosporangium flavigriseum]NJC67665.1 TldD/PmbA family protein [Planosporangium flavigriseum]GIG75765.1 peptidase U62 [Planosporangium flavigriseum]